MRKLLLCTVALVATANLQAQIDLGEILGVSRTAWYQQLFSKRGDEVAMLQPRLEPFYHGVASGDPNSTSVILWTRVTPRDGDAAVRVSWVIATDTALSNVITSSSGTVTAETDFCYTVEVADLQPGTTYYYAFRAYDRNSLIGRTKTTPSDSYDHARIGVVTCSNYPAGFFNAYGRLAERNDIDMVLHMGDYIYEYDADESSYAGAIGAELGRSHEPDLELVELADYRTRYAQYRLDPDLIRFHQQHPIVHVWDDHESANDAYTDGAQNHDPETQGSWQQRKEVSKRVHGEWMPVRNDENGNIYRSIEVGDLVRVSMLDTRLEGRDKQVQGVGENATPEQKDSLFAEDRGIMSEMQFDWLSNELRQKEQTWNVIGSQVLFSPVVTNPIDTAYLFDNISAVLAAIIRTQLPALEEFFELGFSGDVWSNYPVQRERLVEVLGEPDMRKTVVVSGDFHTSWALDGNWPSGPVNVVEFMTPSITSPNFDENLAGNVIFEAVAPQLITTIDTTLVQNNQHIKYVDLVSHGYMILDVKQDQIQSDWYNVDTLYERTTNETWVRGHVTTDGRTLSQASAPAANKANLDDPAPLEPFMGVTSVERELAQQTVLGFGPNPTTSAFYISLMSEVQGVADVSVVNAAGMTLQQHAKSKLQAGLNTITLDLQSVPSGAFYVRIVVGSQTYLISGIKQR